MSFHLQDSSSLDIFGWWIQECIEMLSNGWQTSQAEFIAAWNWKMHLFDLCMMHTARFPVTNQVAQWSGPFQQGLAGSGYVNRTCAGRLENCLTLTYWGMTWNETYQTYPIHSNPWPWIAQSRHRSLLLLERSMTNFLLRHDSHLGFISYPPSEFRS